MRTVIAVTIVAICFAAYLPVLHERYGDFRAFYCAGRAVLEHADPYREHPLRECERDQGAPGISKLPDDAAIPAPFPGYVLAAFALLALLPFGVAAAVWLVASLVAVALACIFIARCTGTPPTAVVVLIAIPAVPAALQLGQITPFVALAIAATALLVHRGKPVAAACAALGIALEPHVAVAVYGALFIGIPATRKPLLAGGAVLAALTAFVPSPATALEYVRYVVPGHATANLLDVQQFSTAHAATLLGVGASAAQTIATWWYIVAVLSGVATACALRHKLGDRGLVLVPIAFEVFGGVHVHVSQLLLAIPAFLIALPLSERPRRAAVFAIFFAATPWISIANYPMFVPIVAVGAVALCVSLRVARIGPALMGVAAILLLVLSATGALSLRASSRANDTAPQIGNPLAEESWRRREESFAADRTPAAALWSEAVKIPTMLGFAVLLGGLAATALRERPGLGAARAAPASSVRS